MYNNGWMVLDLSMDYERVGWPISAYIPLYVLFTL